MAKKMAKKLLLKLWNLWTSIASGFLLLILGGSMASKALGLPSWLSFIPAGVTVFIGWFFVVIAAADIVFSIISFIMKL